LQGRRALVTGSASGIGLATAELLARSGAHVAMNDLPTEALARVVDDFKGRGFLVDAVPGDLSASASAREVSLRSLELLGGIDFLVNNAGAPGTRIPIPPSDLDALTDEFWDRILRINLLSAFWVTKALASALIDARGAVVNTVSVAAFGGGGSSAAYATAKAGLAGLTRELARGLAPAGSARLATWTLPQRRRCPWRALGKRRTIRR
jgi:3-oxoacyl-[acyl-carrier protein] reductase